MYFADGLAHSDARNDTPTTQFSIKIHKYFHFSRTLHEVSQNPARGSSVPLRMSARVRCKGRVDVCKNTASYSS